MDLRRLRYFVTVARTGSYSGGARQLHVAQPALWKQVQTLERELGLRLFERQGRRVLVTSSGRQLLERCETVVQAVDGIAELAGELRSGRAGVVTVSCSPPHVARFLAAVLAEFARRHPAIRVHLRESEGGDPVLDLAAGAADLAIGVGGDDTSDSILLYRVFTVLVPPPGHRLEGREQVEVAELRGERLVVAPLQFRSREQLRRACTAAGFEPLVVHESSSPAALLALAQAGLGAAVLSDDALPLPQAHSRALLLSGGKPLADDVRMYKRPATEPGPALAAFLAEVRLAASRGRP